MLKNHRSFILLALLLSIAAVGLFLARPLDPWLWNFPLELVLPPFALLAFLLLIRFTTLSMQSTIGWLLYLFALPLCRPPLLTPRWTFTWHFLPLLMLVGISVWQLRRRNVVARSSDQPALLPRWGVIAALLLALALRIWAVSAHGLKEGPIDIGTATMEGASNLVRGIDPYTVPEEPGPRFSLHRQRCVYPPLLLLAYAPFSTLFTPPNPNAIYVGNAVFDLISLYLLYQLASFFFTTAVALGITLLHALNPVVLLNLYVRGTNDAFPFTLFLLFLVAILRWRSKYTPFFAGFAVSAKWFAAPVVGLVVTLLCLAKKWKEASLMVASLAGVALAFALPFLMHAAGEFIDDLTWEGRRDVDEWEIPLSFMRYLSGVYSPLLHAALIGGAILFFAHRIATEGKESDFIYDFLLLRSAILLVALFALLANVFHHNYVGWFYSLLPILWVAPSDKHYRQSTLLRGSQ